jgi:chromosome segregation ATPase
MDSNHHEKSHITSSQQLSTSHHLESSQQLRSSRHLGSSQHLESSQQLTSPFPSNRVVPPRLEQDINSHLSAVSHAGFLQYQRDTALSRANTQTIKAAKFRSLSFRLAAHAAARDAQLAKKEQALKRSLRDKYVSERRSSDREEERGREIGKWEAWARKYDELLVVLDSADGGSASKTPEGKMYKRAGQFFTPPDSGPDSDIESVDGAAGPLPDEVLELCRIRVEKLLHEAELSRQNVRVLRDTELDLRREVAAYQTKVASLKAHIAKTEEDIVAAEDKQMNVLVKARESQSRIIQLENEVEKLKRGVTERQLEMQELRACVLESDGKQIQTQKLLDEATNHAQRTFEATKQAEKSLETEIQKQDGLVKEVGQLKQTISAKENELRKLGSQYSKSQAELKGLTLSEKKFATEAQVLTEQLEKEKEKTATLIETERELRGQIAEYETLVQHLRSRIQGLEKSLLATVSKEAASAVEKQLAESKAILEEVEAANKERMDAIIESNNSLNEALKSAQKEISSLRRQLKEVQAEADEFQKKAFALRRDIDAAHEQESQLKHKIHEFENLRKKYTDLQRREQHITSQSQEREKNRAEMEDTLVRLQEELKSEKNARSILESKRNALEQEIETLRERMEELRGQFIQARRNDEGAAAFIASLQSEHNAFREEMDQKISWFENEMNAAKSIIREKDDLLDELRASVTKWEVEVGVLKATIKDLETNRDQGAEEQRILAAELDQLRSSHTTEVKDQMSQTDTNAVKDQLIQTDSAENNEHIQRMTDAHNRIAFLEMQQADAKSRYEIELSGFKKQSEELRTLRRSHGNQVQRISDFETKVHQRDNALGQFHQHFRVLQARVTKADKRIAELEAEIRKRNDQIASLLDSDLAARPGTASNTATQSLNLNPNGNHSTPSLSMSMSQQLSPSVMSIQSPRLRHRPDTPDFKNAIAPSRGSQFSQAETRIPSSHSGFSFWHWGKRDVPEIHVAQVDGASEAKSRKKIKFKGLKGLLKAGRTAKV